MEDKGFDTINVIPLVDVMLVLLTIVLTTSTFIAVGAIPVQLPQASAAAEQQLKSTTISIDKSGSIFLDNQLESKASLRKNMICKSREIPVVIRADKDIALQLFVDVMDIVKDLGFQKVSLQTEKT
ncbi:MAG: biopolymer transporter ExbD [Proteobacteria bacterium]|nr:biopolymer transporter ExbD [Pseudomonadota bacterium]MBU1710455.1 biopolymer transporter ExbD [Pseudomonadota bacterium]